MDHFIGLDLILPICINQDTECSGGLQFDYHMLTMYGGSFTLSFALCKAECQLEKL